MNKNMRLIFQTIAFLLFTTILQSQIRDTIYLWPDKVPNERMEKHPPVQTDNTTGDVTRITDITNPALVVFEPKDSNNLGVGVIVCPGGSYKKLAIDKEGYEIAEWLNKLGYTAFVLQYRVPNNQLGALNDIQRAIRIVRNETNKYSLNPEKIGVIGFSAGGSLCARASTQFAIDSYPKVDTIDTLSCKPNFSMLVYPAYLDNGEDRSITPELVLSKDVPPFFIFGTSDDSHGNSSLVFSQALRDNQTPIELHLLQDGGHGYGMRPGNIAAKTWPSLAEVWLNMTLKSINKKVWTHNFPKSTIHVNLTPKNKNLWVFIMAGQSNMAGRGFVEPKDTIPSKRVFTINKNKEIILAKAPLNIYEPSFKGLDCGLSFGKRLIEQIPDSISVLILPTAVGGSSINQWLGDSIHRDVSLLSNFKDKVEFGKSMGILKGILWHQGESDANKNNFLEYEDRLSELFTNFRAISGDLELPILLGELGAFSKNKYFKSINNHIRNYALTNDLILIKTSDLIDKGDKLHFNSAGQRLMGQRFADEYIKKY
ncbi:MAG TPA: hypothetical protein ENH58_04475 [Maribacter sp.]|nr:hypothetical protein [Maribacter sp.]